VVHPEPATRGRLPLGELYLRLQSGALKLGTAGGQWAFGLSMLKESLAL